MTNCPRQLVMDYAQQYRNADPESSKIAAETLKASGGMSRHCMYILATLKCYNGSTSKELAEHCILDRYQIARRLPELEANGYIERGIPKDGSREVRWWVK